MLQNKLKNFSAKFEVSELIKKEKALNEEIRNFLKDFEKYRDVD